MENRREFLQKMAGLTSGIILPKLGFSIDSSGSKDRLGKVLPKRKLGRTGEYVTMLGVGGYHIGWTTEKDAQNVIETAIEGGVRFFDTAEAYDNGGSETRYGKYLTPKYRDVIFLMTKTQAKDAKTARQDLEDSLRRMKTDHLDLWQMHSLFTPEDVDTRIQNKVLEVLLEAKRTGKVRYIGFTGHQNPAAHLRMLEKTKDSDIFDTCQMPVNVLDPSYHSFIEQVTPELMKRNMGLLAMKSLADGRFFAEKKKANWKTDNPLVPDKLSIKEALYFTWSMPVSVLITGAENETLMREKIELARHFKKMDEQARNALIAKVAAYADGKIEYFKKI